MARSAPATTPPAAGGHPAKASPASPPGPPPSLLRRLVKKIWWLHSGFALTFGIGVMLFARAGLAHADKILMALMVSWLLMFVAFRFIVGPTNRNEHESVGKKGVRLVTNYIIKQFYQQMFFFLVPLYALSATWSLSSFNWWLAPILLVCAVVSTMDLVFDNYIMERRALAAAMYGLAMFGVLNVMMPLVFGLGHFSGLLVAAAATPTAVALLSFPARAVLSSNGIIVTLVGTAVMLGVATVGRGAVPPAPLAMPMSAVGHGTLGSYECMPAPKQRIWASQLDGLRCGSLLREPGGLKEGVVHRWEHAELAITVTPERLACDDDGEIFRSYFPVDKLPSSPQGAWRCVTLTTGGQLVGITNFHIAVERLPLWWPAANGQPEAPPAGVPGSLPPPR